MNPRKHPPAWRRLTWRGLAAVALGIAVAAPGTASAASPASPPSPAHARTSGTATAIPGTATAKPAAEAPGVASHAPSPAPGLQPVSQPGLSKSSYTVTLPTGDKVTLARDTSGKYQMAAAPGTPSRMTFRVGGKTAEQAHVYADTGSATEFVLTHLMDPQAFDVTWLAGHGDTGAGARIPLTVHYSGQSSTAALTAKAKSLTGATVVHADASSGDVDLSVNAAKARAFWAALTGGTGQATATSGTARPAFAGGATTAWLTGHQSPASVIPAGTPSDTITWTFTKKQGDASWCGPFAYLQGVQSATSCPWGPSLYALTGAAEGQFFYPTGISCLDTNPCTTYSETFTVPNGIYTAEDSGSFYRNGIQQWMVELSPQITAAGDTTVTTDLDKAAQYTVDTPRAAVDLEQDTYITRTAPTGSSVTYFTAAGVDVEDSAWITPTTPVTVGGFQAETFWVMGRTPLSAAVTAPSELTLHPYYPSYSNHDPTDSFTRFSGTTTAQVVNVGYGSAADFANADVRGKLVLMRKDAGYADITTPQLTAALQAGAVGVLIDPRDDQQLVQYLPVRPEWALLGGQPVQIPFATITPADAAALTTLLGKGAATVSITDHGDAPYFYNLAFAEQGRVPAAVRYSVSDDQLAQQTTTFHSTPAGQTALWESAIHPDDVFDPAQAMVFVPTPSTVQMYYGPVSPDLIWAQDDAQSTTTKQIWAYNTFDTPGPVQGTAQWDAAPLSVGTPAVSNSVAQTGLPRNAAVYPWCALCRQGDYFYPWVYQTYGANPELIDGPYYFPDSLAHFYQNGVEVPQTTEQGYPVYQLSDQPATDRFTVEAGNLASDWTFTSQRPTADGLPQTFRCWSDFFGDSNPCGADPLIQLRYNAFTDAGNAVTANAQHQIQITPYTQADPTTSHAVTSLKVWTSTDGGGTWTQAAVSRSSSGSYSAQYRVPALSKTDGSVSVKVQATDAASDSVTQTLYDSYSLTAG